LEFCKDLDEYTWDDTNEIDYSSVGNCDPFPMLLIGSKLRREREKHCELNHVDTNMSNTYAHYMRFYKLAGSDYGKDFKFDYGKDTCIPVTSLKLSEVLEKSRQENRPMGEIVTDKANDMAKVLVQGNMIAEKVATYCLREIIRNIPEHSWSNVGWYCAQYWPKYDLVEFAIVDEGRGILESLNSNVSYAEEFLDDVSALQFALKPGITCNYSENMDEEIFAGEANKWKNSGYGLYYVSELCVRSGGSFLITSNSASIMIRNNAQTGKREQEIKRTSYDGTAIRMRMQISELYKCQQIVNDLNSENRDLNKNAFKTASNASTIIF